MSQQHESGAGREPPGGFPLAHHCRKCGYQLSGLTSEVCPECGTSSSQKAVSWTPRVSPAWFAGLLGLIVGLFGLAVSLLSIVTGSGFGPLGIFLTVALILTCGITAYWVSLRTTTVFSIGDELGEWLLAFACWMVPGALIFGYAFFLLYSLRFSHPR